MTERVLLESLPPLQCLASYFAGCATAQLSLYGACPNSLRRMAQIRVPVVNCVVVDDFGIVEVPILKSPAYAFLLVLASL